MTEIVFAPIAVKINLTGTSVTDTCNGSCVLPALTSSGALSNDHHHYGFMEVVLLVYILYTFLIPVLLPALLFFASKVLWDVYNDCSRDTSSHCPLPPGDYGLPIVGETLSFLLQGRKFFDDRRKNYGNVYKTHMLGRPTIRIIGAKHVRQILNGENVRVTSQWPSSTRMLLGDGSLSSSIGITHAIRKKAILRAFTNDALGSYTPVVHDVIRGFIKSWCDLDSIFGYQEFKSLTFELTCRVLLGIEMDKIEKKRLMGHFETFLSNLFCLPICVPGTGLYKGMKAREVLLEKIEECITRKQESGSPHSFNDALSLMMEIHGDEKLTLQEVKDVGLELLFAGHETTASAACTLVLQLSKNPDVLFKICEELAQFGLLENLDINASIDKINKLKYTRNVVKEVLRIAPPIGAGYRKALCTMEIEGYQIPKGWTVAYSIRDSHETDKETESPEKFDPDRWNNMQSADDKNFLAFGGGKKACAGKEFALLVLRILAIELSRSCSWKVLNDNPKINTLPVPHPVDNLPMIFTEMYEFRQRALTV